MFLIDNTSWAILFLAFGTGLMHALDADHVMAVTAISANQGRAKEIVRLCLNWSLGHGITLLLFCSIILLLDLSIPHNLSRYAELGVALILITIGILILRGLYKSKSHIHFHTHDKLNSHAHWHQHIGTQYQSDKSHERHNHSAVIVGAVHGLAGLAPLLVVLPLSQKPFWLGIVYLVLFCLGVFISMTLFGGFFSKAVISLEKYGVMSMNLIRGVIAFISISLGVVWLSYGVA